MPKYGRIKNIELESANIKIDGVSVGTTANLSVDDGIDFYIITGVGQVTTNLNIQASGTIDGRYPVYLILYAANMVENGGKVKIFNKSLSTRAVAGTSTLYCAFWDGAQYQVTDYKIPGDSIDSATIALSKLAAIGAESFVGNITGEANSPTSITPTQAWQLLRSVATMATANYQDGSITLPKLANLSANTIIGASGSGQPLPLPISMLRGMLGLGRQVVIVPVDLDSSDQSYNTVCVPYNGFIERIEWIVTKSIAAGGNVSVTPYLSNSMLGPFTPVSGPAITIPAETPFSTVGSWTPTDNNFLRNGSGNYVSLDVKKSATFGGRILFSVVIAL